MIQFISHFNDRFSYADSIRLALEGGCKWIQLRMKSTPVEAIRPLAEEVKGWCRAAGATFIIDDHVELVREVGADGVHLGKMDMPIREARSILGDKFIIGGTANTFDDVERLWRDGANYIGLGPYRFTTTKEKLSPVLGLEGYRDIMTRMREADITIPVVAIGGIKMDDIAPILATGVNGIALSGAVLNAEHPEEEMARLVNAQCTMHNAQLDFADNKQ